MWTRLLVEGGPALLRRVITAGLADELWVFVSGYAASPPAETLPKFDIRELQQAMDLPKPSRVEVGTDVLLTFRLT
jgi:riboflavin biosynthesis pyrimidine reductase